MLSDLQTWLLAVFAAMLTVHGFVNLYLTLYAWADPARIDQARAPKTFRPPLFGFSLLLPSRHEHQVIGETLRRLATINYPVHKFELIVLCTPDDQATINAARASIARYRIGNARVVVFDPPSGKARAMNIGLAAARHELVTIFDAEDDVSPDILNIANTLYHNQAIDILQGGVQLMNFDSQWFSAANVLEYFFWFKSRMHYYARSGIVPLGGNTVFFKKRDVLHVGGWDEKCLTEDADIGIRLSLAGKRFGVMYDAAHVTREETPATVAAFIKQRTRWNQGFLQITGKGDWRRLSRIKQISLVLYILQSPSFMAWVLALAPVTLFLGWYVQANILVSLLSFMPLILSVLNIVVSLVGLYEFGQEQVCRIRWRHYFKFLLAYLPYQLMLAAASWRALWRHYRGQHAWEKTAHFGAHRPAGGSSL
jgi:cellulose synthase/poly-beta-1,6-N-acetylglucosamine synthase-like glycosyltransferase